MKAIIAMMTVTLGLSDGLFALAGAITPSAVKTPSAFIENKGQIIDSGSKTGKNVLFYYESDGFTIFLRPDGFSYQLAVSLPSNPGNYESGTRSTFSHEEESDDREENDQFRSITKRIDVNFQNANSSIRVEGTTAHSHYFNFYTSDVPVLNVPSFQKVIYHEVYKGIDLVFYFQDEANGRHLKYDWVVYPHGKSADIKLSYNGMHSLALQGNGSLLVKNDLGFISEGKPVIVNQSNSVSYQGKYLLRGSQISFDKIPSKKGETFIIDPEISWGVYLGGPKKDLPDEIAVDTYGNVYVTGRTKSHKLYVRNLQVANNSSENENDAFLAKFNSAGALQWCTYYGGTNDEKGFCMAIDPVTQEPVIAGKTGSKTNIAYNCIDTSDYKTQSVYGGRFDGFVAKFSTSGQMIRSTYVGGEKEDYFLGIACYSDENNNTFIYATGTSESTEGIVRPSYTHVEQYVYSQGDSVNGDIIVVKFNGDLSERIWGTYYGKISGQERGHGAAIDRWGNVYVLGTLSGNFAGIAKGSNVFQAAKGGKGDAFLARWNDDGTINWFTFYGGAEYERGRDIEVDMAGNIYFNGYTYAGASVTFPNALVSSSTVVKSVKQGSNNDKDGFIAKFKPSGERVWGTYFGGEKIEEVRSLSVNPMGSVIYLAGYTTSKNLPVTPDAFDGTVNKDDYFFAKINHDATKILYCTYFGTDSAEGGNASTFPDWYNGVLGVNHATGDIYISSGTNSICGIDPSLPCPEECNYGDWDAFIVKFTEGCGSSSDGFEPNEVMNTITTPFIPFDQNNSITCSGLISNSGVGSDVDYYRFTIPANNNFISIQLVQPSGLDFRVKLLDETGNVLATGVDDVIETEVQQMQSYYLLVEGVSSFSNNECYQLEIIASDCSDCGSMRMTGSQPADLVPMKVRLFPNPAYQVTRIAFEHSTEPFDLVIMDMSNRVLYWNKYSMSSGEIDLNIADYAAGCYLVNIISTDSSQQLKLIVAK